MKAAERSDLASLIDLLVKLEEVGRLADRLESTSDRELEELSHYTMEPAAKDLAQSHPAVAAKVFRALCIAGKRTPMETSFLDEARWRWAAKTKL